MYNLTWKCVSSMKKNKDTLTGQLTTVEKQDLVACYARLGINTVDLNVPMDDNGRMISVGSTTPSPRTIEAETQDWCDVIHAQLSIYGNPLNVLHRPAFCGIENIYNFPFDTGTAMGSAASAATDGNTTWCGRYYNWLYNHVGNHVINGDIFSPIPEGTTHAFDGHWFAASEAAYRQLFADLHTITNTYAAAKGVTVNFMSHNNFSEVASGYIGGSLFSNENIAGADYYGQRQGATKVQPSDYVYDWQQLYLGKDSNGGGNNGAGGVNQFQGEWGDLPSAVPAGVEATDEQWLTFLKSFYKAFRDNLVSPNGHLVGFNYWGGWEGQNTSILFKDGNGKYQLNGRGKILAAFFTGNGIGRIPNLTDSVNHAY